MHRDCCGKPGWVKYCQNTLLVRGAERLYTIVSVTQSVNLGEAIQHLEFLSIVSMFCKSTIQCFMCPCFFVYDENVIKIGIKNFLKICFENNERLGPNNYSHKQQLLIFQLI